MYLCSVAYSILRRYIDSVQMKYGAMLVYADSLEEALGTALQEIKKKYPFEDHWYDHAVEGFIVDDSVIDTAYQRMRRRLS